MDRLADIMFFECLSTGSPLCGVFNGDSLEERIKRMDKQDKMTGKRNFWRNSLIGLLATAAGVGGVGAGLDYIGGHKDLPLQPTPGIERAADFVHGGLNDIRGVEDKSKLADAEKRIENLEFLKAYEQAQRLRAERENTRLKGDLRDTTIAKENWKQADLNRGKQDTTFGPAFKQELKNNYGSIIAKLLRGASGTK